MDKNTHENPESAYQKVCKVLNFLFVEGLSETRDNAEVWQKWIKLREDMANALFGCAALLPMVLVTVLITDTYANEIKEFPDLIRVILVEAVLCWCVIVQTLINFIRCAIFKGWLVTKGML
jgi:hypothetical protein